MGRAGRHIGLRAIRKRKAREKKTENNPKGKMMTTASSAHRVPSLTLTLELIPSCCGHPNVLLTQPIGQETTSTTGGGGERRKKNTTEKSCSSPFLSTQDAFPDRWKRFQQAI